MSGRGTEKGSGRDAIRQSLGHERSIADVDVRRRSPNHDPCGRNDETALARSERSEGGRTEAMSDTILRRARIRPDEKKRRLEENASRRSPRRFERAASPAPGKWRPEGVYPSADLGTPNRGVSRTMPPFPSERLWRDAERRRKARDGRRRPAAASRAAAAATTDIARADPERFGAPTGGGRSCANAPSRTPAGEWQERRRSPAAIDPFAFGRSARTARRTPNRSAPRSGRRPRSDRFGAESRPT